MSNDSELSRDHDKLMEACRNKQAKMLYEGISAVYVMSYYRKWEDLFPVEREEIIRVMDDADENWWTFLAAEIERLREKHGYSRVK